MVRIVSSAQCRAGYCLTYAFVLPQWTQLESVKYAGLGAAARFCILGHATMGWELTPVLGN